MRQLEEYIFSEPMDGAIGEMKGEAFTLALATQLNPTTVHNREKT